MAVSNRYNLMFATLPFLLISICSPLLYYLSCLLSHFPPSSLPSLCRAVVSLQPPQSSPHRKSWRRSKPVSLESRLGDFQPLVSGLLSGPVGAWELAAQGDYCWRQINHTWQAIVQKAPKRAHTHTRTYTYILTQTRPSILHHVELHCLTSMEMWNGIKQTLTSRWILLHKVSVCVRTTVANSCLHMHQGLILFKKFIFYWGLSVSTQSSFSASKNIQIYQVSS